MRRLMLMAIVVVVTACSPGSDGGGYQAEYGGSAGVYTDIAADADCDSLQARFDQAAANNDAAEPGTDAHSWTLGYMTAADDRMQDIGCY